MKDSEIEKLKQFIILDIEDSIDAVFTRVHQHAQTKSGDITPEQKRNLSILQNQLMELIFEQVTQNLGGSKYFEIDGYYKDDKSEFSGYIVKEFDDFVECEDENVFFFGLSEKEIIQVIADGDNGENPGIDFVITSYKEI